MNHVKQEVQRRVSLASMSTKADSMGQAESRSSERRIECILSRVEMG